MPEKSDGNAETTAKSPDNGTPELSDEQLNGTCGGGSKDSVYLSVKIEPETIRSTTTDNERALKTPKAD